MPYIRPQGAPERASRLGHVRTALDPVVNQALAAFHLPPATQGPPPIADLLIPAQNLKDSGLPAPSYAVAIDGSCQEVEIRPDFPSARVGFTKVAGVCAQLDAFRPPAPGGFVDPVAIASATSAALVNGVVPTSVVTQRPGQSMNEAWREAVHALMASCVIEGPGHLRTSLLEVLSHVLGDGGIPANSTVIRKCPGRHDRDCQATDIPLPFGGTTCSACGTTIYFSDAASTGDEVLEDGSNATALGRLMNVLELLTFLWQIHIFSAASGGRLFPHVAFILDGPLSMFGRPAGLKRYALRFLQNMHTAELNAGRVGLPVIIGLEKTGTIAEHAAHIRKHIPTGTLMCLPDRYIRDHIQHRAGNRSYGYDTDYGRRFIYRATDGRVLVFSVPPLPEGEPIDDADNVDPNRYPTLFTSVKLLDRIGTLLYQDAVIPVALAHNFAALPLGTGSQVLTNLAQDVLGIRRTQAQTTAF